MVDPSRNRLASIYLAYFAKVSSLLCMHGKKIQKWSNLHEICGIGWIGRKIKFQIFPIFIFQLYFSDFYLHAWKTLKPGFFWYAVDTSLFRLGSTNPKKILRVWMLFGGRRRPDQKKLNFFFFKNNQTFSNKFFFPIFFLSKVFKFTWKVRNRLNRRKNQISDFSNYYF